MTDGDGRLAMNFDAMNETDVREIIVRPLLHRLGYRHGTEANIRSEVTLRYGRAFLGRKNPRKDPDLVGRADYICELTSFGRWAVEVKAPQVQLDRDAVEQAHTYAAHPEIAAVYFLLTNGREFQLYQTAHLDAPMLTWKYHETEESLLALYNIVSPDAIRNLANLLAPDDGKPLGRGIASRVELIGGVITYDEHESDNPLVDSKMINGLQLPVTGGSVSRAEDGRLHARVEVGKAAAMFGDFAEALGIADDYNFYSADEYISTDADAPTIFQNIVTLETPAGKMVRVPGIGEVATPFGTILTAFTEAVGFFEDGVFRGRMRLEYDLRVTGLTPLVRMRLSQFIGNIPDQSNFSGGGSFEVRLGTHR
jgi:hypothetical protein